MNEATQTGARDWRATRGLMARGGGAALVISAGSALLGFGLHLVLARAMGVVQFGIYALVLFWLQVLVLAARFGMDTAVLRYASSYGALAAWGRMRSLLRWATRWTVTGGLVLSVLTCLVAMLAVPDSSRELRRTLMIGAWVLPVWALTSVRQAAMQAWKHAARSQTPEQVLRPALLLGLVGMAWLLSVPLNAPRAAALLLLASIVSLAAAEGFYRRLMPPRSSGAEPERRSADWMRYAAPVLVMGGLQMAIRNVGVLVTGAVTGPEAAGVLAAVTQVTDTLGFGLTAVNVIAAPLMSEFHSDGRQRELQRVATISAGVGFGFAMLAGGALIVGGRWIMGLFGNGFAAGEGALRIMVVGQLFNAGAGSVGCLMTMTGDQVVAMWILAATAVIQLALCALLIPCYGLVGAAVASATAVAVWNVALCVRVRLRLGLDSSVFPFVRNAP